MVMVVAARHGTARRGGSTARQRRGGTPLRCSEFLYSEYFTYYCYIYYYIFCITGVIFGVSLTCSAFLHTSRKNIGMDILYTYLQRDQKIPFHLAARTHMADNLHTIC